MAKGLPIVIVNPIPGQEDRNTEFLLNNGVAMSVTPTSPLDEVLFQLFSDEPQNRINEAVDFIDCEAKFNPGYLANLQKKLCQNKSGAMNI